MISVLRNRIDLLLTFASLGFLWLLVWKQQSLEWQVNPLYSYGWAVPLLSGYLVYERFRDAALPRQKAVSILPTVVMPLVGIALIPMIVIHEANPDWVRINWLMTATALLCTFSVVAAFGGWRWAWHFTFPLAFTLTALPWPVWAEEAFTQGLMRVNTLFSAECLSLCGIPALPNGNTIAIGRTVVDIEEACSGIRSLQTAFMMSLFLGEFHRLRIIRRLLLVCSSFAVAFLLNSVRTITLTYIAGHSGPEVMHQWHDPMGNFVMIGCLVSLWGLSVLASKGNRPFALAGGPGASPLSVPQLPYLPSLLLISGIVVGVVSNQMWYGYHESKLEPPILWSVKWPQTAQDFSSKKFDDRTVKLLKFNEGERGEWTDSSSVKWSAFYLRWYPGRVSKFLAGSHYPTVCFPAAGLNLVEQKEITPLSVGKLTLPFRTYIFKRGSTHYFVFHALAEERPSVSGERVDYRQVAANERIASVLAGNRNLGQRVLGITISGNVANFDEALAILKQNLPQLIDIQSSNK